jgi:transcriptional regulator with XRE-family HTH domain
MVRFHRKKAKLTQLNLAKLSGIGKTAVFDIEQGKETVRLSTLVKLLKILNIRIRFDGPLVALFEKEWDEKS